MANTFNRHDFSFSWSHAEMSVLVAGVGKDWAVEQTAKCIQELVELTQPDEARVDDGRQMNFIGKRWVPPPITITNKSGESFDHLADSSVDCVVMDPPYYDNVMYAELSDFFYVWLKRTAGQVFPELFLRQLTDKENEAIANPATFQRQLDNSYPSVPFGFANSKHSRDMTLPQSLIVFAPSTAGRSAPPPPPPTTKAARWKETAFARPC